MKSFRSHAIAGAALMLITGASHALTFNITFTGTAATDPTFQAAFNAAAARWSAVLTDNVTVNLSLGTAALGSGILAQAGSSRQNFTYSQFYNALTADRTSASDFTAVGSLGTAGIAMLTNHTTNNPNGSNSGVPYFDNTGANALNVRLTTANAKALGLTTTATSDATITFATGFNYDFDPSNGVNAGTYDFIGLAAHEIGHALGFVSGVDQISGSLTDNSTLLNSMDLFRYSAASFATGVGVVDFTADGRVKYFSIDGGLTNPGGANFSTGTNTSWGSDGRQASHWKDNQGIGIMDPTAASGETLAISANDLLAFDVIGWNVSAVPEPSTYALFGLGLVGLALRRRRAAA